MTTSLQVRRHFGVFMCVGLLGSEGIPITRDNINMPWETYALPNTNVP